MHALESSENTTFAQTYVKLREYSTDVDEQVQERENENERILILARNTQTESDNEFPQKLQTEVSKIQQFIAAEKEKKPQSEIQSNLDEGSESDIFNGKTVSIKLAQSQFEGAIRTLALAKHYERNVAEKSQEGLLLSWLGDKRLPPNDDLKKLGQNIAEIRQINQLQRPVQSVLSGIVQNYRNFREIRFNEGKWYQKLPSKKSEISRHELDLLILVLLKLGNEFINLGDQFPNQRQSAGGILKAIKSLQRAQILVDEATDFSPLQLASMYALAHPVTKSFFICGDLNQRLTEWGIKSSEELEWVVKSIQTKEITVAYRQSQKLVDLARKIAKNEGAKIGEISLPDRVNSEGFEPVWKTNLQDDETIAKWLSKRIDEIITKVGQTITIGVLVNSEDHAESLAPKLDNYLKESNLSAIACRDGKFVGDDQDVRVFNINHIKGLEFEAVFFVNLDETIEKYPNLYSKYLYVGATRAATFLGVTFQNEIPKNLEYLSDHFEATWE